MEKDTRFFDDRARHWEETCYPPAVRHRLAALFREFKVKPGERVLDVGTGPGILLPHLQPEVGRSGQICAFDLSFEMIRSAAAKPLDPNNILLQADTHFAPFRDGHFDRVICFAAFPHFERPEKAVCEMGRVLRVGGELIIAHLMSREELARHHATHQSVKEDRLPDHDQMKALFLSAGFNSPHILDVPGKYIARGIKKQIKNK